MLHLRVMITGVMRQDQTDVGQAETLVLIIK